MKPQTTPGASRLTVTQFLYRSAGLAIHLLFRPNTYSQFPSLVRKGFGPVWRFFMTRVNSGKTARLIRDHATITFVCSYPRSGNTWMRYLLSDILAQNEGVETTTERARPGKFVPDYYSDLITSRSLRPGASGHLIKTHDIIPALQKRIGADSDVRQCKYLYLYRSPEDVLVSLFHYSLIEAHIQSNSGGNLDLFCLEYLPAWTAHLVSYLDAIDDGFAVYLINYEELLRQPAAVLDEGLRWLGIPHTPATIQRAESNMRFGNLLAMDARLLSGGTRIFRRGVEGTGASELKPETLAQIRSATKDVMARANEHLARQRLKGVPAPAAQPYSSPVATGSYNRGGMATASGAI